MPICTKCDTSKVKDEFSLDRGAKNGLKSICKACEREKYVQSRKNTSGGQPRVLKRTKQTNLRIEERKNRVGCTWELVEKIREDWNSLQHTARGLHDKYGFNTNSIIMNRSWIDENYVPKPRKTRHFKARSTRSE